MSAGSNDKESNKRSTDRETVFIIDGFAQLFRAYHAIRSRLASPVTKEPTNATFGFVGMLLKVMREYRPDYLVLVIDKSGDQETFRSDLYEAYKANREPPPMDFGPQVDRSLEISERMGIPILGVERYEADDVIATLVRRLEADRPDLEVRIVSKDKDLEQLLSDRVSMIDVHKDELVTVDSLMEKKGVRPDQVIDVLALMGDTVDNVPGVSGVGPKTAAKLVHEYGSVEALYERLDEIKGKRRENLEAARETIPLSKRLVTLCCDVEFDFELESARVNPKTLPTQELIDLFKTLGFGRYQDELLALVGGGIAAPASSDDRSPGDEAIPGGLFGGTDEEKPPPPEPTRGSYEAITTRDQLDALVKRLRSAPIMAIDTETTDTAAMRAGLCGISVSVEECAGVYIPVRSPDPASHLDESTVLEALRPILEDPERPKCGHNLKYDWVIFRRHGVDLKGMAHDSMIASYLVDSARPSHGMDALAQALLNYRCIPISDLIGKRERGKKQLCFDEVDLERAAIYAAEDADVSLRLCNYFEPRLKAMGLKSLFDEVEMPLVRVLAEMEYHGIRVDPEVLARQRAALATRIEELRAKILDAAPHDFNPDSPKQLAAALFNKPDDDPPGLGLKVIRRGKTGPSTNIEVLERLAADPDVESPVPQLIVEYRQLTKLVNTYLASLDDYIHPETKRVHASFNQTVAATGRLSSSDPNLQNIPIRTDVGRQIRQAFVAEPGHQLITADYSQIELRLLAHLSEDENLIEAFRAGEDIHTAVAAEVFDTPPDQVTREQRNSAKMVNFGIIYGITPWGLARRLGEGVSNEDAKRIIDDYKARFPGITEFLDACVAQAMDRGYVETMLNRRRAVPQVHSRNPNERSLGERMAINSVVQGSAADLIKLAMVDLDTRLPEAAPRTKILLQIHDELVFEAPGDEVESALPFVVERMEAAMKLRVPLKVEAAVAPNWLESK
ncbi:MAG: DNA polymerase I [Phycisphaerales bacterium]